MKLAIRRATAAALLVVTVLVATPAAASACGLEASIVCTLHRSSC